MGVYLGVLGTLTVEIYFFGCELAARRSRENNEFSAPVLQYRQGVLNKLFLRRCPGLGFESNDSFCRCLKLNLTLQSVQSNADLCCAVNMRLLSFPLRKQKGGAEDQY